MPWWCPDCGKGGKNVRGPARHFCTAINAHAGPEILKVQSGPEPPAVSRWAGLPQEGPGLELEKLLAIFGVVKMEGCSCERIKYQMNSWGPDGCERRKCKIVGMILKEASRRGWWLAKSLIAEATAKMLVERAIRNARVNNG